MSRSPFQPMTVVPGATRAYETNELGKPDYLKPITDKKGRPVWNMPRPVSFAIHFKNEACKRNFFKIKAKVEASVAAKEIDSKAGNKMLSEALQAATNQVPVYRGLSAELARKFRAEGRRKQRESWWRQMMATAMGGEGAPA